MFNGINTHIRKKVSSNLGSKGSFFYKSLILILIIASIPGLITAGIIYRFGVGQIENQLQKSNQNQIQHRALNIDDQFNYLEMSINHWSFEPRFSYSLKDLDLIYYFQETNEISQTLSVMQGSDPLIQKVELYIEKPQPVLFDTEYSILTDQTLIQTYDSRVKQGKPLHWVDSSSTSEASTPANQPLELVAKIPGGASKPFGAIIVTLDQNKVIQLLKTLMPYDDGAAFLMNSSHNIIASAANMSEFNTAIKNEIIKRNRDQDSFRLKWKGEIYAVSYGTFSRIGSQWTYVSAAPMTAITASVVFISKLILFISIAGLLLALLMSWIASRRIYLPVERLVRLLTGEKAEALGVKSRNEFEFLEKRWHHLTQESRTLQNKLEEQLPQVKEGFLLQMVQGYLYSYTEQDLLERMKHYGWKVEDQHYIVLHIQLTGFSKLSSRFSAGDEGLVTFAAANIIEEMARDRLDQSNVVNFHDLSIGLLVIASDPTEMKHEIHLLSEELTQMINHVIKVRLTITISKPTNLIRRIPHLFEEVKQAASYREFEDQNQILDMEFLDPTVGHHQIKYPFALEREILQSMRMGNQEETESLIAQFLEEISGNGCKEITVQQSMFQLLGGIQHMILHTGINPYQLFKGVNLSDQLSPIREPNKMLQWMNDKVVSPFIQELSERSHVQLRKMVEKAIDHIETQYMTAISLDSFAELAGTTTYTLSKAFKLISGKNFIDYLTEVRMEKAKEFLRSTDLKINEVSEQVGYQHSYFNRIFKKQEGLTPSQYREINQR